MAFIYYNRNIAGNDTGDCVIRAISIALNQSWSDTYWDLCHQGFMMGDWGDNNKVWDSYLRSRGFKRRVIPNTCPDCYTVNDFCIDHPYGLYVLSTGNHTVVADMGIDEKDRKAVEKLISQMGDRMN